VPGECKLVVMPNKLDHHERTAILARLSQIELERDFPALTEGQRADLEREHITLSATIERDDLLT
jgi:hypothetical protein